MFFFLFYYSWKADCNTFKDNYKQDWFEAKIMFQDKQTFLLNYRNVMLVKMSISSKSSSHIKNFSMNGRADGQSKHQLIQYLRY